MTTKKRLAPAESRLAALEAARALLIEAGPQSVTLKAVAGRIGRTHANLLHHFGSAAGLQKALAAYLAESVCQNIAEAVIASRAGVGSPRQVVDLTFDAFDKQGGGALASWMLASGNEDALDPVIEAIHALVDEIHCDDADEAAGRAMRETTLTLVLLALGDALMGEPMAASLDLPRGAARDRAERLLAAALAQNALDGAG